MASAETVFPAQAISKKLMAFVISAQIGVA